MISLSLDIVGVVMCFSMVSRCSTCEYVLGFFVCSSQSRLAFVSSPSNPFKRRLFFRSLGFAFVLLSSRSYINVLMCFREIFLYSASWHIP